MSHFVTIIAILSISLCIAYLIIQLIFLYILKKIKAPALIQPSEYPSVSILIAARNEAENIVDCLKSLDQLDYPSNKIEILIGNDLSTDYTQKLTEAYIKDKPKFRLINLTGLEHPSTKGKARVLATLADAANGEYYLITDADIIVNPNWAKTMVETLMQDGIGMCGGTTDIVTQELLGKYQRVDWLYFMGIIHSMAHLNRHLTVVGNNMGISAEAYNKTGGYGKIPFSITEDYALFEAVKNLGYKVSQVPRPETLIQSKPMSNIKGILKQRKRWLTGGLKLPLYYHLMIFVFGAWYICLPILFFINLPLALGLMIVKDFIQLAQIVKINQHLNIKNIPILAVLTYDLYLFLLIPLTSFYFLMPYSNTWKGRKY